MVLILKFVFIFAVLLNKIAACKFLYDLIAKFFENCLVSVNFGILPFFLANTMLFFGIKVNLLLSANFNFTRGCFLAVSLISGSPSFLV